MPLITDITHTWSAGTATTGTETWQCQRGAVFLSVQANPDNDEGIRLLEGQAVEIAAGKTVQYRLAGGVASAISVEAFK